MKVIMNDLERVQLALVRTLKAKDWPKGVTEFMHCFTSELIIINGKEVRDETPHKT